MTTPFLTLCSLYANISGMAQGRSIEWSVRSIKDMRRLAERDRERIIAKIEQYSLNPADLANQVRALTNSEYLRMRVGNYRVIFRIENGTAAILVILRVRHRREAYD